MKQKKAIEMGTLKEYIQQKYAIKLIDRRQKVHEETQVLKIRRYQ